MLSFLSMLAACGGRASLNDDAGRSTPAPSGGTSAGARGGSTSVAGSSAAAAASADVGGSAGVADAGGGRSADTSGGGNSGSLGGSSSGVGGAAGMPNDTPLWRSSTEPFCPPPGSVLNRNPIWSDARGVSVVTSSSSTDSRIDSNDGSGWKRLTEDSKSGPSNPSLTGFPYGPLVEYGNSACAISFIEGTVNRCSGAGSRATAVSIVDAQVAYAVYDDRVLSFNGSFWVQWGGVLSGKDDPTYTWGVWASKDTVVVVADAGKIFLQQGMKLQQQAAVPAGDYRAVWGFGATDIWAGNQLGELVHFDGKNWSVAATLPGECAGIRSLWGRDDTLFFTTDHAFGLWRAGVAQILGDFSCAGSSSVMGVWGNSKKEVFFATQVTELIDDACSGVELFWFDGTAVKAL